MAVGLASPDVMTAPADPEQQKKAIALEAFAAKLRLVAENFDKSVVVRYEKSERTVQVFVPKQKMFSAEAWLKNAGVKNIPTFKLEGETLRYPIKAENLGV